MENDYAFSNEYFQQAGALLLIANNADRFANALESGMLETSANAIRLFYTEISTNNNKTVTKWAGF